MACEIRLGIGADHEISPPVRGVRVARSRANDENLGGYLSDTVRAVVEGTDNDGFGVAYSLEGDRIFTTYSKSPMRGSVDRS